MPVTRANRSALRLAVAILGAALATTSVHADEGLDELERRLATLEMQAREVDGSVKAPTGRPEADPDLIERRIVQAQVAYGVGRFADATLLLYDIVERHPQHRSHAEASFYLADSLFQKGDNLSARGYFKRIAATGGPQTPHYAQTLERLIELTLRLHDSTGVEEYLAKLDQLPPGVAQADSVPYVRGKYAYFTGNFEEASRFFDVIPATSRYHLQGRYFAGVVEVARTNLAEAARILHALTKAQPRDKDDEKVLELAHLALGRLHYERDQPSDAIDHYLSIGRRSPYFDEALFEVAWVYVKARQFDKALRALELLALANPKSAMLPDVRILEGNLRIRKAQALGNVTGNATEEYAKANQVFEDTRATYEEPRKQLARIVAEHDDPRFFFAQITGRAGQALEVKVELPDVVVAWMREVPEVQRVLGVSKNLDEIRQELDDTTTMIERMERAVTSPSRTSLFPALAERRGRSEKLGQRAFAIRQSLATHEKALVTRYSAPGDAARFELLRVRRNTLERKLASMPNSADSFYERVRKARTRYLELDKQSQRLDVYITSIEAEIVALDKYYHDVQTDGRRKTLVEGEYSRQLTELRGLVAALRKELDAIRQDILVASDEAGLSGEVYGEEQETRRDLSAALEEEHRALAPVAARMSDEDRADVQRIGTLLDQARRVEAQVAQTEAKIDRIVDEQLTDVRVTLAEQKRQVADYRQTLVSCDGESADVGGDVVAGSFEAVARKFYEIGVRSDVGLLDVSWSQKELSQQSAERLRLDFAHEKQQIERELRTLEKEEKPGAAPEDGAAPPGGKEGGATDGTR